MEEQELDRVNARLRQACLDRDLTWVVDAVDAALGDGVADSANDGSSAYRQRRGTRIFGHVYYDADPRARPDPQLRVRPYTSEESVLLLIDAMLAVYDVLPSVQAEALSTLRGGWNGRVPVADSVVVRGDGDPEGGEFRMADEPAGQAEQRGRVVAALIALRAEVTA
ncbi:hypothetical protein [Dactylosporangium sp. NPDC051541]|uniref:hypothetical protein n=1 Tax=Dactylosporangium sp. NPDC051541 TaxID=3363977 RepID=UPI0037BA8053